MAAAVVGLIVIGIGIDFPLGFPVDMLLISALEYVEIVQSRRIGARKILAFCRGFPLFFRDRHL